ncbi:membrane-anchored mycosin MYCP [Catenulispora sp. GP43]|uniref:S8 family serine peptidase n=1 Tax=Catenulispora sp. GP43 TaxID=3156263 RepID=UPI003513422C
MPRPSLRTLTVAFLAAGCLFSGTAAAQASQSLAGQIYGGAPVAGAGHCTAPLPAPDLPAGDAEPDLLWPQQRLGLSQAGVWYLNRGKDVTVAVIDTGVDPSNPAFAPDAVLPGPSVVDPGDTADYDCSGHGTAVAAIIAGKESGLFGFTGVAPEAQILPIRQTYDPNTPGSSVKLADAIRTATAAGARIINISIGVPDDSPQLRSAVQNALASDVLIVAAVGPWPKSYPAATSGVLAVGAINVDGSAIAPGPRNAAGGGSGSGTGALVSAPGGRMAVPAAGHPDGLTAMQGTDLAAPYVSGVAALVLSYRPTLHNWQVAQRLEATADPPVANPSSAAGTPATADPVTGYGVVDPYRAVSQDLPDERRPDPSAGPGVVVSPADAAVPGHDRGASRIALAVSTAGVLVLAAPVAVAAARRGRVKGSRAGV